MNVKKEIYVCKSVCTGNKQERKFNQSLSKPQWIMWKGEVALHCSETFMELLMTEKEKHSWHYKRHFGTCWDIMGQTNFWDVAGEHIWNKMKYIFSFSLSVQLILPYLIFEMNPTAHYRWQQINCLTGFMTVLPSVIKTDIVSLSVTLWLTWQRGCGHP